jgi:DNA ligase-1
MLLYKIGESGMLLWEATISGTSLVIQHGLAHGSPQTSIIEFPTAQEATVEAQRRYNKKRDREGYTAEQPTDKPAMPMLATSYKEFRHKMPAIVAVQPKMDGIRCVATNSALLTRRNEPITSVPHISEVLKRLPPGIILDGELYSHDKSFQDILSLVKRGTPKNDALNSIIYCVFDIINENPFRTRQLEYQYFCDLLGWPIIPIATELVKKKDVEAVLRFRVDQGFEGVMVRDPEGFYEPNKRSYYLQKYKSFSDTEFQIVDIVASARGREEGAAIYVCVTPDGKKFRARPRMSLPQRSMIYRERNSFIGYWTRITYQGLTNSGVPRQPIAEGLEPTRERLNG